VASKATLRREDASIFVQWGGQDVKRWVATAAIVLGLLGAYIAPAHADPTNSPNAFPFTITCDGMTYPVVGVSVEPGTPVLVTTSNVVLIPFSFDITLTNLTTGESMRFVDSKEAVNHAANASCSFNVTFPDPQTGETFRLVGSAEGLRTPPGRLDPADAQVV
jgi:hypothetical protein